MRHAFLLSVILLTLINGTYIEVKAQDPVTVTISKVPDDTQREEFPITITFGADVTGFEDDDIELGGGVTATVVLRGSSPVYTALITPTSSGDLTIKVPANVVDGGNQASNTVTVTIDIPPTVTLAVPSTVQNAAFEVTITFDKDVTGLEKDEILLTGPASVTSFTGTGAAYTAIITPNENEEGSVTIEIEENVVVDGNKAAAGKMVEVDTIVPTVEITDIPTIEKNEAFDITITFSEPVNGFEASDITITGPATASPPSGTDGDTEYTLTITPDLGEEDDVTITVNANAVKDLALNNNTASAVTDAVHVDTIVPTVEITGIPTIEKNEAFDITITFSEPVNGFEASDITITGPATASPPSGTDGDTEYTLTITPNPTSEGDVTIKVDADTVTDLALNDNTASIVSTVHIDTIVPTVTGITGIPTIEKNVAFDITITFSEEVNGFAVADLTIDGPATASLSSGTDGDLVYTVTITPNPTSEDDVTIKVDADTVTDLALNDNTASSVTDAVHVDTIVPTVTDIIGIPTIEKNVAFDITITFSEEVNGFAIADLTIDGPATASLSSGTDGDLVYTVTITPNPTSEDDVTIKVDADTVTDLALNDNTASSVTDAVHVDTIVPTVEIITPTIEKNVAFNITIAFSEEVNGFAVADLTINGPATATLKSGADGDTEYTVTITPNPTSEGDVTIKVDADTVTDLALNDNTASIVSTVHIDTIVPTVTGITGIPTIEKNVAFDITITFSEEVNGFAIADLTIDGPATASLSSGTDGDLVYTVTITPNPTSEDDVTIKVDADTVTDLALNDNTASSVTDAVHVDTIVPTVEIITPTIEKNVAFNITIAFSEEVNGFDTNDFTTNGPVTVSPPSWNNGDTNYTLTITPNPTDEGDFTITVKANTVTDSAFNRNTDPATATVHIDTIVPMVEITDIPDTVQLEAFSLTILFSEDVNEFLLEDISFSGDAVIDTSTLEGTGSTYTLTITPHEDTDGDVIVQVPEDIALDLAENLNTASFSETIAVAPIWIPDPNLRAVIRDGLGRGLGDDFSRTDLEDLTILNEPSRQIDGLTGLENAINLTQLNLNGNFIRELNLLSDLTKLTSLKLNDNSITAIDALRNLVKLTTLELSGNRIGTLTALNRLINLKTLDLSENRIKNISPIAGLTALTNLNLTANEISDVSSLANFRNLRTLRISENTIADTDILVGLARIVELDGTLPSLVADPALRNVIRTHLSLTEAEQITIVDMENLTALELESIGITSLAGLEYAIALTTLNLSDNRITDITLLQGLSQLTTLTLNDNSITDITPLQDLTALTNLDLSNNSITDITPLQDLTALTNLDLGSNSITDITPLQDLDALTTLTLSNNPITDFAPLAELTTVTALELSRNSITDLNVISQLPQLLTLDISDNSITNITLLQNLTALTTLNLRGNTVSNLNPILQLTDLTHLDLSSTSVQDLRPLAGLTQLTTLHLNGNTLSDVTPLATLTNLTTLSLAENTITRLNAITTLTQLTTLTLEANSITDVTPLASLPQLTALNLRDNTIGDVTPLAGFLNLSNLIPHGQPDSGHNAAVSTNPAHPSCRYRHRRFSVSILGCQSRRKCGRCRFSTRYSSTRTKRRGDR